MRSKLPCKNHRRIAILVILVGLLSQALLAAEIVDGLQTEQSAADNAVFWAIEQAGLPVGYLLGTIHSEDPRVVDFSTNFLARVNENQVFAMELVPDLPTLSRLSQTMSLPPDKTLESVIGTERFTAVLTALAAYQVPVEFIGRMKPWAVMMTLSTPPPRTGFFMDLSLSLRASGNGLKVIGLETLEQQLSFLEEMPPDMQLALLDQAIAEAGRVGQVHDRMVDAYLENDLQKLQTLSDEELKTADSQARDYFTRMGINARNHRMLESLLPHLVNQRVFVAVGALHLPGQEGLLNLLRHAGFDLTPLDTPFTRESKGALTPAGDRCDQDREGACKQ